MSVAPTRTIGTLATQVVSLFGACEEVPFDRGKTSMPSRAHRVQQVLGDSRVHHRHTGDIDKYYLRPGLDDPFEKRLSHVLGTRCIQTAYNGQCQDAVPDLDDWRLQFHDRPSLLFDHPA